MILTDAEIRGIYFALGRLKICCCLEKQSDREIHTELAIDSIKSIFDDAAAKEQAEKIEKLNREILFQNTVSDCIHHSPNP